MKTLFKLILVLTISTAYSQNKTTNSNHECTVYLIRETGLQGALKPVHIFFNTEKVCKLNNNRFSIHQIKKGDYTIYAQSGGKMPKKKALKIDIVLERDQVSYIYLTTEASEKGREFYELSLGLVTEAFASERLKELKPDKKCD